MSKRPSPDSVACVDLTDDAQEERLGDVRKQLSKPVKSEASGTRSGRAAKKTKVKMEGVAVIDIDAPATTTSTSENDDIEVVDAPADEMVPEEDSKPAARVDGDDEVVIVGAANQMLLPHMRQHCTECTFVPPRMTEEYNKYATATMEANTKTCDLCYCYVCDCPAKECSKWSSETGSLSDNHCCANDKHSRWVKLRQQTSKSRNGGVAGLSSPSGSTSQSGSSDRGGPAADLYAALRRRMLGRFRDYDSEEDEGYGYDGYEGYGYDGYESEDDDDQGFNYEKGPFAPGDAILKDDRPAALLTQCRKCNWYSRLTATMVGSGDWCHKCGIVICEDRFGKQQCSSPYKNGKDDILLGERIMPFTIVAHDPRDFDVFKNIWTNDDKPSSEWTYDEAEMEDDTFRHRLGKRPLLKNVLDCIPIVEKEKMPKSGHVTGLTLNGKESSAAEDTEGIVLENRNDLQLLQILATTDGFRGMAGRNDGHPIDGDIVASWDKTSRAGTLTIRVFLSRAAFTRDKLYGCNELLGVWFKLYPFSLSELGAPVKARQYSDGDVSKHLPYVPLPPFELSYQIKETIIKEAMEDMQHAAEEYNKTVEAFPQLSLTSSNGSPEDGGMSLADVSLEGALKRFFREPRNRRTEPRVHTHNMGSFYTEGGISRWVQNRLGVISRHRSMRRPNGSGSTTLRSPLDFVLTSKEAALVTSCLPSRGIDSMNSLLKDLENIGHDRAEFVDGLNVQLLDFQLQSLKWALERETVPGGIQAFFWPRLPSVAEPNTQIYYNPILGRFRKDTPKLIRGGLICEEMGLGKTVISLSLILQNPAPTLPESGSLITSLKGSIGTVSASKEGWDRELYANTSISNSKRGSILSRGTLVVCPVSLVGQWIEEAKSKLSDPGLIYPYHGQSRKRDASILAKNAIVVTTYQVLASDATYHAAKGGANYCPPLEQVRWWRIICDEGHSLRDGQTSRSRAAGALVADHKWIVTGTPVNTSFKDLKNQLKFLGVENVDAMFSVFLKQQSRNRGGEEFDAGKLLFFLRNLMIRHTQKQTYRGTTTTLMSLPAKTERKVEISFSDTEQTEYDKVEQSAKAFYSSFKAQHGKTLSSHYLKISQKLTPMRVACSGGKYPLDAVDDEEDDLEAEDGKKRKTAPVLYSDFAFTSKFKTLLKELENIRDKDPTSKSLVFSQYTSTLKWLQEELPKHGFQFRTLSGDMSMKKRAKALHDFQSDPPTTIFLLSMRAGAVGINLTQANSVFLMEPCLNPALEAQAIGRVHRLGQKREVEIVRLIMKDSVESRLLTLLEKKYGDSKDLKDDSEDSPTKPTSKKPLVVGNVCTDRTTILTEEFDLLFDMESQPAADDDSEIKAEPVGSSGFV